MEKDEKKISIPLLVFLFFLGFIPGIIYLVVKLGGIQGTSEAIGDSVKTIKERSETNDKYDDIKKLQELKKSGAITAKEYEEEKKKILSK